MPESEVYIPAPLQILSLPLTETQLEESCSAHTHLSYQACYGQNITTSSSFYSIAAQVVGIRRVSQNALIFLHQSLMFNISGRF